MAGPWVRAGAGGLTGKIALLRPSFFTVSGMVGRERTGYLGLTGRDWRGSPCFGIKCLFQSQ